jgi:hypothetical protein
LGQVALVKAIWNDTKKGLIGIDSLERNRVDTFTGIHIIPPFQKKLNTLAIKK